MASEIVLFFLTCFDLHLLYEIILPMISRSSNTTVKEISVTSTFVTDIIAIQEAHSKDNLGIAINIRNII